MNCKPGDLAVIVRDEKNLGLLGRICRVLHAASTSEFRLPDGYLHVPCSAGRWAIDFNEPINVPLRNGNSRWTRFAVANDAALRPIRDPGDDAIDEMVLIVGKPEGVTA